MVLNNGPYNSTGPQNIFRQLFGSLAIRNANGKCWLGAGFMRVMIQVGKLPMSFPKGNVGQSANLFNKYSTGDQLTAVKVLFRSVFRCGENASSFPRWFWFELLLNSTIKL